MTRLARPRRHPQGPLRPRRRSRAAAAGRIDGPHFLGQVVNHAVLDPRDGRTLLAAVKAGHLGPTVFRSDDLGETWKEAARAAAFAKARRASDRRVGRATSSGSRPAHASEPGRWYAGTSPQGLFVSDDGGRTWDGVAGFNDHPERRKWIGGAPGRAARRRHAALDQRRSRAIPRTSTSACPAAACSSRATRAPSWTPLNRGCAADFLPDPDAEYGHDPALPARASRDAATSTSRTTAASTGSTARSARWERIGEAMPREIGDIGFPIVLHPRDPDDALGVPDGWRHRLAAHARSAASPRSTARATRGASWQRQDRGLPRAQAWFTVKRQAMAADALDPVGALLRHHQRRGLGELRRGRDAGSACALHLPHVYSVETALRRVKVLLPTPLADVHRATRARSRREGAHARRAARRPRPALSRACASA